MGVLYIYEMDGSTTEESIETTYDIFRKVLKPHDESSLTELEIARKLLANPQKNVVKIYDVVEEKDNCYIDMECLDDAYQPLSKYVDDLKDGLLQLHSLGVVYIDIKSDNIGFSPNDNVFKIYDFDCSGIACVEEPTEWERRPFYNSARYKSLKVHEDTISSLYEIDALAFEMEYKKSFV